MANPLTNFNRSGGNGDPAWRAGQFNPRPLLDTASIKAGAGQIADCGLQTGAGRQSKIRNLKSAIKTPV
jgi:hypothetical protein